MKKAQVQQAFTFIIFILVAALVLILGYQGVKTFTEDSCEAQKLTFQQRLSGFFDRYDDYGSVHEERLNLPCDYGHVCFVDSSYDGSGETELDFGDLFVGEANKDKREVIQTAGETDKNIFLVGRFAEPAGYSEKIQTEDNLLCVEARGGAVNLVFKGQGRKTLVEEG